MAAIQASRGQVICLYILSEDKTRRALGGAARWWLDKSLRSLQRDIARLGGKLILRRGEEAKCLQAVITQSGARAVYWNRRYGLAERDCDADIKADLKKRGIAVESFNGSLLTEPWTQTTKTGGFYRVFTPYWKAVRASYSPSAPQAAPARIISDSQLGSDDLDSWGLHPVSPDWSAGFDPVWQPGEAGAAARLEAFLAGPVDGYAQDRNRPDLKASTSGLSPHLAFGEIGPQQIWHAVETGIAAGRLAPRGAEVFLSEIVWREFSYVLLYHNPHLAEQNYNRRFEAMAWRDGALDLRAWQLGRTGYPIVDAGMRQLWQTGWMHNRVRMIVASFLTKHLLIDWRAGEAWFWDCLVDADPASNAASWQWVAGSGADAAPYFRIFNPISQGEKFDETGDYVRHWCPELSALPRKYLYQPWAASPALLGQANVVLGETYPHPVVDHPTGRARALAAYAEIKDKQVV